MVFAQNLGQLGLGVVLLRIGSPVGQVAGNAAFFRLDVLVDRDHFAGAPLAQPHQALVYCDSNQPCVKFRIPLKLIELLVRLQERVLHDVFSVFAVLRDVLRNPEDLPVVLADELVVRRDIAGADPFNKGYVGMRLVFVLQSIGWSTWGLVAGILQGRPNRRPDRTA